MTKKSTQKLKYLANKKAFEVTQKAFFIIFKELSVAKNCLRPESVPLNENQLLVKLNRLLDVVLPHLLE